MKQVAHLVTPVSTPDEFVDALEDAIAHDTPQRCQARMAEARNHSWEARFAQTDRFLEEVLARRAARGKGRTPAKFTKAKSTHNSLDVTSGRGIIHRAGS